MERLRTLRKKRGLTLRQLEDKTGIGKDAISEIERGQRQPRADTLARLAEGLGVSPQELLREVAHVSAGHVGHHFLTNDKGERMAVVLPLEEYEELLELAEGAAALRAADEALAGIERGEEPVPWKSVRDRIGSEYDPGRTGS